MAIHKLYGFASVSEQQAASHEGFVGTGSLRQTVSGLVQIRTAGLVLAEIWQLCT
jgi:hypothetical protein